MQDVKESTTFGARTKKLGRKVFHLVELLHTLMNLRSPMIDSALSESTIGSDLIVRTSNTRT